MTINILVVSQWPLWEMWVFLAGQDLAVGQHVWSGVRPASFRRPHCFVQQDGSLLAWRNGKRPRCWTHTSTNNCEFVHFSRLSCAFKWNHMNICLPHVSPSVFASAFFTNVLIAVIHTGPISLSLSQIKSCSWLVLRCSGPLLPAPVNIHEMDDLTSMTQRAECVWVGATEGKATKDHHTGFPSSHFNTCFFFFFPF